ncbi:DUF5362 domain-containing protein [Rubellicoccus peritrichatus]|uniref:DUF5362 domain-containing protein n=1 Tax=Rubellicoccus peritrichatus TaxID=3080537 RepID=A0AAQ3L9C3_9BACT|nr:DUF5362 domain-containing protein [Puniceicoccus sp. CR14]WOO41231.1 DUF5362 domain-containing protein [Puniceicoccus sp. CR14]
MDEYHIVGGDGNEYGPVSADEIRSWVKQGRANAQTMAGKNGGAKMALGTFAEFASCFSPAPQAASPTSVPQPNYGSGVSPSPMASAPGATAGGGYGQSNETRDTVMNIMEPLSSAAGWMKFLAIMFFIAGGFNVLSIWGIIFAWLPIWMGVLMWKAATRARATMIDGSELTAESAMASLKTYFTLMGVLMLIYLVVIVGLVIFFIAVGASGLMMDDPAYY